MLAQIEALFSTFTTNLGLLLLRVAVGTLIVFGHGWGKLVEFSIRMDTFPDPLGIGSPLSLAMALFAEVFCASALVLGWFTRLVCIPLIVTMLVAAVIVHADDPWSKKELALTYLVPFATLFFTGAGAFSLDALLLGRRRRY